MPCRKSLFNQILPPHLIGDWRTHDMKDLLQTQAETYVWRFGSTNDIADLQSALDFYVTALAVVDSQKHYYWASASRETAVRYQLPLYEAAIGIAVDLNQLTGEESYASLALLLSEKKQSQ